MYRRIITLAGMVAALALPLSAGAMTTDELRAQIASLLSAISQLQLQVEQLNASSSSRPTLTSINQDVRAGLVSAPAACPALTRSLQRGATGSDVRTLQSFLMTQEYLSSDGVTGYFGALTESAVKRWQANNGIVSSGSAATTGWGAVGSQTRAALLDACDSGTPKNDRLSIGSRYLDAFIQATVNVRASCNAVNYTLDYGDGTAAQTIHVPAGTCRPLQQTFTHTYVSAGAHTILLTSPTSRVNALVTLTAAPACRPPTFATDDASGAVVGMPWTLPLIFSLNDGRGITVTATGTPASITLEKQVSVSASTSATTTMWTLSGTPTTTGMYTLKLAAGNSCGTTTRALYLRIATSSATTTQY